MNRNQQKQAAAEAAIEYVPHGCVVGVGTGSTVNYFIDALAAMKHNIDGAVASSKETERRLKEHGITVYELNVVDKLPIYVDGADEVNRILELVKGGGGALTREKILANASREFICIADESKQVGMLGKFPLPVEVIPMARSYVAREIVKLGGDPVYRDGFVTDNDNIILDIHNLKIMEPIKLEKQINQIAGVVSNGLFALRPADVLLVGTDNGVEKVTL